MTAHDPDTDSPETTPRLLRAWARGRSESAFRELTERYLNMVHSVAVRRLGAHHDAAPDVTQAVFVLLARKAEALPPAIVLGAWLHRQTVRLSLNFLRGETRRRAREQEAHAMKPDASPPAWNDLAPVLDEAIASLDSKDRDILHLRYFEDETTTEIAATLGISRDAAQKRMERALENLRVRLRQRMALPSSAVLAIGTLLSGRTVQAAPPGLAGKISAAALTPFRNAGMLAGIHRTVTARPLIALTGAAAGLVLGWISVRPSATTGTAATTPPAETTFNTPASSFHARPSSAEPLEPLLAALSRIGAQPQTFRTEVAFKALMERPDATDLHAVAELSMNGLSGRSQKHILSRLLEYWTARSPREAMDFLADHPFEPWAENKLWKSFHAWCGRALNEASDWLMARIKAGDTLGSSLDSVYSLTGVAVDRLTRSSPEAGFGFYLQLPSSLKKWASRELVDDDYMSRSRTGWESGKWAALANLMAAAIEAGTLDQGLLPRLLARWRQEKPDDVSAWQASLSESSRTRFLAGLTAPSGSDLWARSEAGQTRENPADYQTRIEQAVRDRGSVPLTEALTVVASTWKGQDPELIDLLQSQNRVQPGAADQALTTAVRRMTSQWPSSPRKAFLGDSRHPAQVSAIEACESITDPATREPLIIGLFRRWHASDPEGAATWPGSSDWPDDRLATLHQRLADKP